MRCLVADDHELIREGVKLLLNASYPAIDVREATHGQQVLDIIRENSNISFVLLDYNLPETNSLMLIREISENYSDIPVIVFSGLDSPSLMKNILYSGASGFVQKSSDNETLLHAINVVLAGGVYKPRQLHITGDSSPLPSINAVLKRNKILLTERQKQVLKAISDGSSNKEIADSMNLSVNTIKVHITAILQILRASNRTEAVVIAREKGLI